MKAYIFEENINHKQTRCRACITLRNQTQIHLGADKMRRCCSGSSFTSPRTTAELKLHQKNVTQQENSSDSWPKHSQNLLHRLRPQLCSSLVAATRNLSTKEKLKFREETTGGRNSCWLVLRSDCWASQHGVGLSLCHGPPAAVGFAANGSW